MIDLAWPEGLQVGLSDRVAGLLNEPVDVLSLASAAGYRCFTTTDAFRAYVNSEVLGADAGVEASDE
jgi:hypothetical protein